MESLRSKGGRIPQKNGFAGTGRKYLIHQNQETALKKDLFIYLQIYEGRGTLCFKRKEARICDVIGEEIVENYFKQKIFGYIGQERGKNARDTVISSVKVMKTEKRVLLTLDQDILTAILGNVLLME